MNIISPKVPSEYQEVEYLTSDGNQYINTNVIPNSSSKIEISFTVPTVTAVGFGLFGSRTNTSSISDRFNVFIYNSAGSPQARGDFGNKNGTITNYSSRAVDTATIENKVIKVNGETIYTGSGTFTGSYPIWLFDVNTKDASSTYPYKGKIYSCKIWQDGVTLSRNFIPVHDIVDNVYGMFDTVEEKFYGNAGSGAFTAGPEIKRVEYLESSGT